MDFRHLCIIAFVLVGGSLIIANAQDIAPIPKGADRGGVERPPDRDGRPESRREKRPDNTEEEKPIAVYSEEPVYTVTTLKWKSGGINVSLTFLQNRNEKDSEYIKRVFNTTKILRKEYVPE